MCVILIGCVVVSLLCVVLIDLFACWVDVFGGFSLRWVVLCGNFVLIVFFNMCNCDEFAVFNLDVGGVDVVCERCGDVVC